MENNMTGKYMLVRCVKPSASLTLGKIYEAEKDDDGDWLVRSNDEDRQRVYFSYRFVPLILNMPTAI
jgi:hypothetical protein